jgi:ribose 5-phosphate isomerase A
MTQDDMKRAAGEAAAALAEPGMTLGLGTGSTTAFAIEALGRRVREEGLSVLGVPTSFQAEGLARQHGVLLATLDDLPAGPDGKFLDIAFDGADEVVYRDGAVDVTKGRGAAHVREKVVAAAARRFVVLIDPSKEVGQIGEKMPIPIELLPMALPTIKARVKAIGGRLVLRMGQKKDGPVVSDQGLWIADVYFSGGLSDPAAVAHVLNEEPGVLGHGLFLGMATDVLVGERSRGTAGVRRWSAS